MYTHTHHEYHSGLLENQPNITTSHSSNTRRKIPEGTVQSEGGKKRQKVLRKLTDHTCGFPQIPVYLKRSKVGTVILSKAKEKEEQDSHAFSSIESQSPKAVTVNPFFR